MVRNDIEFMATPVSQTPDDTSNAKDNSDGVFFTNSRLPDEEDFRDRHEFSLPPVDGGKDAWLFLSAVFVVDALIWGFPFAFGVFQDYYLTHEPFIGQPNIAVIGTSAMGVMYLASPIIMGFCQTFGRWARWGPILGLLVMSLALALSSFASTTTHLIVSQGVLYGLGGSFCYCPCIMYLGEWFVNKKGLAYGMMWSGTGLAGVILPLLLQSLLGSLGFRNTLRVWAALLFVLAAPAAFLIKPRLPPSATSHAKPFNLWFLVTPAFLVYQTANIVESMGYFLPGIYLPTFSRIVLGVPSLSAATTILLVNVASVFGCVAMGWCIDRFHVTTGILLSTIGATISVLAIWGLSSSLGLLYFFCIAYGLFAGSFSSAWPGIMKDIAQKAQHSDKGQVDPNMVFGFLCAGRGVGNVVAGSLSETLIRSSLWAGETATNGYSSSYSSVILFTGVTALLGGASFIWKRLGLM
ncbi:major facilitator superfamily domain-containing protein [Xylaria bambusicola]|uniref:major facilitator superfamily domain-containing protein n=1 Tax=Xylaria bambusicola TaxID=326684 RepID=UPI00200812ED|nr:major facilitator superfamily domain-containing protein [Xylaria bambusicola]KAI0514528.1 major facilitator superfamily domain-containing protein [Xylaria bambusicola]